MAKTRHLRRQHTHNTSLRGEIIISQLKSPGSIIKAWALFMKQPLISCHIASAISKVERILTWTWPTFADLSGPEPFLTHLSGDEKLMSSGWPLFSRWLITECYRLGFMSRHCSRLFRADWFMLHRTHSTLSFLLPYWLKASFLHMATACIINWICHQLIQNVASCQVAMKAISFQVRHLASLVSS